ncbi:MAG: glutamate--tRNA ligase [Candidatus Paceibacterota bacterium]
MEQGENLKVVTRFAPSPTGFLHVGNIRTAIFAYLWAKKNNGTFLLRIEDTDKDREVVGAIDRLKEALLWLGVRWDHGPDVGGPHAPYFQSERLDIYKKYALKLIEAGFAYPDPFTEDDVDILRQKAELEKRPFLYREHRGESTESWDGTKPLRFKIPEIKQTNWQDIVFGDLSAGPEALDDFILIKSDGYPTYNFAHIVDDIEMGVTHVMRGTEFIASTPKFLAVYEALGQKPPTFVSLPHIMAPSGKKKLSKRDGAKDLLEYRDEGYLSQAMFNFLAMLGWHPRDDKEVFTQDELVQEFDIKRIQKAGATMNDEKLDWFNKEHIRKLKGEELESFVFSFLTDELKKLPSDVQKRMTPMISERITKGNDIKDLSSKGEFDFLLREPEVTDDKLQYKNTDMKQIKFHLEESKKLLESIPEPDFNYDKIKDILLHYADTLPSRGELLHPVRFALSGQDRSPDPFIIATVLGKNETIKRLQKVLA